MAGDWIKWTKGLTTRIEVLRMAGLVRLRPDEVAGKLMRLWEWCDDNIPRDAEDENGTAVIEMSPADGDNMSFIDSLVGSDGFAQAMLTVRWIEFTGGHVRLPNFFRHNGDTAKTRARNARNQKKKRGEECFKEPTSLHHVVTEMSPQMSPPRGDILVAREEESREEVTHNKKARAKPFLKPTIEEATEYCRARNSPIDPEEWWHKNEAKGWLVGNPPTPMKNWKSNIVTWEKNHAKYGNLFGGSKAPRTTADANNDAGAEYLRRKEAELAGAEAGEFAGTEGAFDA